MTPALQAFFDELTALQRSVEILTAENAVLKVTPRGQYETTGKVTIYGRTLDQLRDDLNRLRLYDEAAATRISEQRLVPKCRGSWQPKDGTCNTIWECACGVPSPDVCPRRDA